MKFISNISPYIFYGNLKLTCHHYIGCRIQCFQPSINNVTKKYLICRSKTLSKGHTCCMERTVEVVSLNRGFIYFTSSFVGSRYSPCVLNKRYRQCKMLVRSIYLISSENQRHTYIYVNTPKSLKESHINYVKPINQ